MPSGRHNVISTGSPIIYVDSNGTNPVHDWVYDPRIDEIGDLA